MPKPRLAASFLARVDLPEPEFPTTDTRRTNTDHSTLLRYQQVSPGGPDGAVEQFAV